MKKDEGQLTKKEQKINNEILNYLSKADLNSKESKALSNIEFVAFKPVEDKYCLDFYGIDENEIFRIMISFKGADNVRSKIKRLRTIFDGKYLRIGNYLFSCQCDFGKGLEGFYIILIYCCELSIESSTKNVKKQKLLVEYFGKDCLTHQEFYYVDFMFDTNEKVILSCIANEIIKTLDVI